MCDCIARDTGNILMLLLLLLMLLLLSLFRLQIAAASAMEWLFCYYSGIAINLATQTVNGLQGLYPWHWHGCIDTWAPVLVPVQKLFCVSSTFQTSYFNTVFCLQP